MDHDRRAPDPDGASSGRRGLSAFRPGPLLLALLACALFSGCASESYTPPPGYRPAPSSGKAPAPPPVRSRSGKLTGTYRPYTIAGQSYTPMLTAEGYEEQGLASWYGPDFHGKKTACGEVYNMYDMTAAHRILPMQTMLEVENLDTGKTILVRVNDRGPYVDVRNRIIDLSYSAARALGSDQRGLARVRVRTVGTVPGLHDGDIDGDFYVQVGAFVNRDNAERLAQELARSGYAGTRVEEALVDGRTFWRVQAGVFSSLSRASDGLAGLAGKYPQAFIVGSR